MSDETANKERKEKDITIAFKGSREFKEKIDELAAASGLEKKEWLEHAVSLYEIEVLKGQEGIKKFQGDLDSLGDHSRRINEIFKSLVEKVLDDQKRHDSTLNEILGEKNKTIDELKEHVSELTVQNFNITNEVNKTANEINELRKQLSHLEELNETRKREIERLSTLETEYSFRSDSERVQHLEQENIELSKQLELLKTQHEAEMYKLQKETLEKQLEEVKKFLSSNHLPVNHSFSPVIEGHSERKETEGDLNQTEETAVDQHLSQPDKKKRGRPLGSKTKRGKEESDTAVEEQIIEMATSQEDGFIENEYEQDDSPENTHLLETPQDPTTLKLSLEEAESDDTEISLISSPDISPEFETAEIESDTEYGVVDDALEKETDTPEQDEIKSEPSENNSGQLNEEAIPEQSVIVADIDDTLNSSSAHSGIPEDTDGETK